ncbi:UBX domain-containing protein 10 [Pungitius pungitius]|uniref:UBX domain-containing protein 10 n=1 Tax=Pungitius pungitius TaxID=134920 RepID=UPI002E0E5BE1
MHLRRPKSSKGRSRPSVDDSSHSGDGDATQSGQAASPDCPASRRPGRSLRSQSQPIMWQASQLGRDGVPRRLQHAADAPQQSLNKYTVLPCIGAGPSDVGPGSNTSGPGLTTRDKDVTQTSGSEAGGRAGPKSGDRAPATARESGSLLLAIRAPCGRRFEQHFEPTDTLLTVRASAELRYEAQYGGASIETMDVPRRTFADMDMSLAQCDILNRSVLCISQN